MEKKQSKTVRELTPREVKVVAGGPPGDNTNAGGPNNSSLNTGG